MALRAFRRKDEPLEDTAALLIPVDQLNVDQSYQREDDASLRRRAERYASEWDPYQLGELHVAERADGTYWVVDGQTRLLAARLRGIQNLRCFVVRGLDHEGEASLFRKLNKNRTVVGAWGDFRAALTARDPAALSIAEVVESCGFAIGRSGGGRTIKAVGTLQKVHQVGGPGLLRSALTAIAEAWDGDKDAAESLAINGVSSFLHQYQAHPAFSRERLIEVLSKIPVSRVMREVKGLGDGAAWTNTKSAGVRAMFVIRHHYNKGLRSRKLPMPVDSKGRRMGSLYDLPGGEDV